jgi:hypothetical protein
VEKPFFLVIFGQVVLWSPLKGIPFSVKFGLLGGGGFQMAGPLPTSNLDSHLRDIFFRLFEALKC